LANANGDVYHFGDAVFHGDNLNTPRVEPIIQIARTPDGGGYWLLEPDAFPTSFSSPGGGARPAPGDFVYYGTGPWSVATAVHMGIVAQVWPDGAITTVEGDAGPAPSGAYNVIMNGPFLPSHSTNYNGVPIFGFGVP
jgi:hypothetical protein